MSRTTCWSARIRRGASSNQSRPTWALRARTWKRSSTDLGLPRRSKMSSMTYDYKSTNSTTRSSSTSKQHPKTWKRRPVTSTYCSASKWNWLIVCTASFSTSRKGQWSNWHFRSTKWSSKGKFSTTKRLEKFYLGARGIHRKILRKNWLKNLMALSTFSHTSRT